jgi:hypothetical protein
MAAPPLNGSLSSPLVTAMADAPIRYMDGAAFDFFLIEMINTLRISSTHAQARARKVEREMIDAGLLPPPPHTLAIRKDHRDSTTSLTFKAAAKVEDEEEGLRLRLEAIGMHVGANITERYVRSFYQPLAYFTQCIPLGYVTENHTSPRRSTASSLFVRISGRRVGTSRLTTFGRTTG